MINPGGSPGTAFSKSAQTRFNNDQINAARATMPFNPSAQSALRDTKSTAKKRGPAVAGPMPDLTQMFGAATAPTQAPQEPQVPLVPEAPQQIDPVTQTQNLANDTVAQIRQQQFINSPQVKDAMTSIRLRSLFNATNPNAMPDNRDLMTRVKARIGDLE